MESIFYFILYFLPFVDATNGYLIRRYAFYGIGSIYHLIIVVVVAGWILSTRRIVIGRYEKVLVLMILSFALSLTIGSLVGRIPTSISIERTEKIIITAFFITALYRLAQQGRIRKTKFNEMLEYQCTVIPIITFFADLTGLANYSYETSRNGRIGFYTNLNETTIVFMIILTLLIERMLQKVDFKHLVLFFLSEICIVLTESKSGVVSGVIFALLLIIFKLRTLLRSPNGTKTKIRKKVLVVAMCGLPVGTYGLITSYKRIYESFMRRQSGMYTAFGNDSVVAFLTSGRFSRFETLLISPINDLLNKKFFLGMSTMLFGFGLTNDYYSTFEMDLFDCMLYGGIFAAGCWLTYNFLIIKKAIEVKIQRANLICMILIMVSSVLIGHIWTGGVCGIYFAMLATKFTVSKEVNGEKR